MKRQYNILVISTPNEFSTALILQGFLRFAEEHPMCTVNWLNNAHIVIDRMPEDSEKIPDADGYVVMRINTKLYNRLKRKRRPIVYIDPSFPISGAGIHALYIDNEAIAEVAARHLLGISRCRSFAITAPSPTDLSTVVSAPWINRRMATFIRTLRFSDKSCIQLPPGEEESILPQLTRPVGIFAVNDTTAFQLLTKIRKLRLRIPDDIVLVGADNNTTLCEHMTPPLSSVDIDFVGEGYFAMTLLYDILSGKDVPSELIAPTHARLVERGSTSDPSNPNALVRRARQIIDEHFAEDLSVRDIADRLQVTRQTLGAHFRKRGQGSVAAVLQKRRLEEVRRLLRSTALPLREIAASAGFPDQFYMMTLFRKRFGLTCAAYRARRPFSAARRAS